MQATDLCNIAPYEDDTEANPFLHTTPSSPTNLCQELHNFTTFLVPITGPDLQQALPSIFSFDTSLALLMSPDHNPNFRLDSKHSIVNIHCHLCIPLRHMAISCYFKRAMIDILGSHYFWYFLCSKKWLYNRVHDTYYQYFYTIGHVSELTIMLGDVSIEHVGASPTFAHVYSLYVAIEGKGGILGVNVTITPNPKIQDTMGEQFYETADNLHC
eukprot:5052683-Ditylum_brightwellii.AAC.1